MQVTVSVAITQLEISATFMLVKVFATNIWVTIFIEIMHVEEKKIMEVVFSSAMHYAHDCFYCNYAGHCFRCS